MPRGNAVQLSLSVLAAFDGRSSHVGRGVTIQPLLAKHREEGGEQGDDETGEENCLDINHRAWRTRPLRERGGVVSEGGVVDLVDEDFEEGGGPVTGVRSKLRVDLDDERGSDCRKQTSLML